mgnify:FL=1
MAVSGLKIKFDAVRKNVGLYFHIPFCIRKCRYCDFYSVSGTDESFRDFYVRALILHIEEHKLQLAEYNVDTVYFGGGTPSLLTVSQISDIMKKIRSTFHVKRNCEVSMEVNPGTVNYEKLRSYRRAGVNRLSIGWQSISDKDLQVCGRVHTSRDNYLALDDAKRAGFKNISVDIMFGLPGQTVTSVLGSIDMAIKMGASHISLYGLKIEEGTPFDKLKNTLQLPDEDTEREMYFAGCEYMKSAGFIHYEISNFARPGFESRHNLKYWNCDEYIGFGASAHSFFGNKRFNYKNNADLYIRNFTENYYGETIVDKCIDILPGAGMAEYVMLRFRLSEGIVSSEFKKRFGRTFESIYLAKITPFLKSGHMIRTGKGYALTEQGMYVSNYILSRIVDFDMVIPGSDS